MQIIDQYYSENGIEILSLHQILESLYIPSIISNIDLNQPKIQMEEIIHKYKNSNLSEVTYPYIVNTLMPMVRDANREISLKSLSSLSTLLSNEETISNSAKSFFLKIIQTNCFGVPKELIDKKIITYNTLSSQNYKKFENSLAEWHTKNEMIILNLSLLKFFYGITLDFNLYKNISQNNNYDITLRTFSKKNFLKLASIIFSNYKLSAGLSSIEPQNIIVVLASSLSEGIKSGFFLSSPFCIAKLVVGTIANFFLGQAGNELKKNSDCQEILPIALLVEKLNEQLTMINKKIFDLLICEVKLQAEKEKEKFSEMDEEMMNKSKLRQNELKDKEQRKIDELLKEIKVYLRGIALDDKYEFEIFKELEIKLGNQDWVNIDYK